MSSASTGPKTTQAWRHCLQCAARTPQTAPKHATHPGAAPASIRPWQSSINWESVLSMWLSAELKMSTLIMPANPNASDYLPYRRVLPASTMCNQSAVSLTSRLTIRPPASTLPPSCLATPLSRQFRWWMPHHLVSRSLTSSAHVNLHLPPIWANSLVTARPSSTRPSTTQLVPASLSPML